MGLAPYGAPSFLRRDAQDRAARARRRLRARPRLLPPSPRAASRISGRTARPSSATCSRPRSRSCSARAGDPTIRSRIATATSPARSRRCTRRHSSICSSALQRALRPDRSRARRRLRDELGRQRQGAADDAVPARLRAVGGRRCRRRDRRGLRGLAQARRRAVVRHGPRLLGPAIRRGRDRRAARRAASRDRRGRLHGRRQSRTRPSCAGAPPRRSPTARSSAGFRAAWNGARARSAIARSSAIRAAPT